ncbi:MAG TPA: FliM/FliN family flagellar motor switch protein [Erysipelotrichaceae bacterium]|nr:FliM/FliN family flagellar motor switch protein [Erysipelotrichaceae bacterium]
MDIINNISNMVSLSIAKSQSIQHWANRIMEVMYIKRKSLIHIDKIELLNPKDFNEEDKVYYAIAQIDLNQTLMIGLNKDFVQHFILDDIDKKWDEFDYSIANAHLNELISHLQMRPHYQFKKVDDNNDNFIQENLIILKFSYKVNQKHMFISLTMTLDLLETYLNRYPDPQSKNLDVMMDVPITVRVELGSIQRKVREIIEFNQGTLLELDQTINSSCKIIVNNHTIAHGDVVEVNGNFGVMMTKIDDKVDFMK